MRNKWLLPILGLSLIIGFNGCSKKKNDDSSTSSGGSQPPPNPSSPYDGTYFHNGSAIWISGNQLLSYRQDTGLCAASSVFGSSIMVSSTGSIISSQISGDIYDIGGIKTFHGTLSSSCSPSGGRVILEKMSDNLISILSVNVEEARGYPGPTLGHGSVRLSDNGKALEGSPDLHAYPFGTQVTLEAIPGVNSDLKYWAGCSESNNTECKTKNNFYSSFITARFGPTMYKLSLSPACDTGCNAGTGSLSLFYDVTVNGNHDEVGWNTSLGETNEFSFSYDSTILIKKPVAIYGSTFTGWSGACSGAGDCYPIFTKNTIVTAHFKK